MPRLDCCGGTEGSRCLGWRLDFDSRRLGGGLSSESIGLGGGSWYSGCRSFGDDFFLPVFIFAPPDRGLPALEVANTLLLRLPCSSSSSMYTTLDFSDLTDIVRL